MAGLDSGATSHIVSTKDQLVDFNPDFRETITVANGEQVSSVGKGTVRIKCQDNNGNVHSVKMLDVLVVPSIGANLISVKKLTEKGFAVNFKDQLCEINFGEQQVAVGDIVGNLYKLREAQNVYSAVNSNGCIHQWHKVLGHRDIEVVKTLSSGTLVKGVQFDECKDECNQKVNCEVCLEGKMTRFKFPQKSLNRTQKVLDLVHSDVCGPMQTETPSGKRYILTFIDDFSRFTIIYLLKNKFEVFSKFKEYVELCITMFGRKPRVLRSDRGGEYMSNEYINYLDQQGIQYQRTVAYTPQQNGVAERKNRTLVEMARCMLIDAKLEKYFWGEAVMMAKYVQNRLPGKEIDKTPFENWFGRKPTFSHFKQFGAKCFTFVQPEHRRKLDSKASEAVLVGYDEISKAYRCYVLSTRKVIVSRDVKFIDKDSDWKVNEIKTEQEESTVVVLRDEKDTDDNSENGNLDDSDLFYSDQENESLIIEDNTDEVVRRSSRINKGHAPKRLIEEVNVVKEALHEPESYKAAVSCDKKNEWITAMKEEMKSLKENQTWELVQLPKDRKTIGCKWVYKIKYDANGEVCKYKARLVAQGFSQKFGSDYDQVFAPVVRQSTFRILLTLAAKENMEVVHFDAKTAFLNGKLQETIFMKQPPGFIDGDKDNVCLLRGSIYGLKQSARIWNQTIHKVLIDAGYTQSKNDFCLYVNQFEGDTCYVLIYVDDIIVASKSKQLLLHCEETLKNSFCIKNLGEIKNYLGLQIKKENGCFTINQASYITRIIKEFGLAEAKVSEIPISVGYGKGGESVLLLNNEKYRQLIGCLLYISVNTRPDISASVSILAQKVSNPNEEDWNELKRLLKYLKGTLNITLSLGNADNQEELVGYADANWAESKVDRKSNSGFIFKLFGGTISWSCKKQTCVALSSTEAEFVALSEACKEAEWLRRVLNDFGHTCQTATVIYEDNQSCLKMIEEEKFSNRSKHIDVKYYFVKDYVDKSLIRCVYCPTESMVADLLTKPLPGHRIKTLREMSGLH